MGHQSAGGVEFGGGGGVHDAGGEAQEDGGLGAGYCVWGELSGYVGSRYRGDSRYGCVGGEA